MINDIKYHKNLYESWRRFELDAIEQLWNIGSEI